MDGNVSPQEMLKAFFRNVRASNVLDKTSLANILHEQSPIATLHLSGRTSVYTNARGKGSTSAHMRVDFQANPLSN